MKGDFPSILSVQGNLIAYTECLGSDTVHIIEISDGRTSLINSITCEGTVRERAGYIGFSPDGTKFATLYIPNKRDLTSYVMISDLKTNNNCVISELHSGEEYIYECSWLNKKELLLVTGKYSGDITEETTWVYNMKEGVDNE